MLFDHELNTSNNNNTFQFLNVHKLDCIIDCMYMYPPVGNLFSVPFCIFLFYGIYVCVLMYGVNNNNN